MELPDDAPKTPKLLFFVADALLIGTAALIAVRSGAPLSPAAVYAIAGCVALGALLLVLPFLLDYNRRQDAQLSERQAALEALVRTTSAAVEQASITANGLHSITELAQRNLRQAEQLPQKLHERINEFARTQDEAMAAELESLQQEVNTLRASEAEKLESAADKIQRLATELAKVEAGLRRHTTDLDEAAKRAERTLAAAATNAVAALEKRAEQLAHVAPVSAPVVPPAVPSVQPPSVSPADSESPDANAPRAAAKPTRAHPTVTAPSAAAVIAAPMASSASEKPLVAIPRKATKRGPENVGSLFGDELEAAPSHAATAGAETPPESLASDGLTRLIVTAYIGIGNKLYARGDGPGLSWERGVPLHFISIGKWRWESAAATAPISLKLYKNDQVECTALGTIAIEPGQQRELSATF